MSKFRIEIDKNSCQGFAACTEMCPNRFQLDENGKSSLLVQGAKKVMKENAVAAETLELDELECAKQGAEACPFNAIHVINLETAEKLI